MQALEGISIEWVKSQDADADRGLIGLEISTTSGIELID
jgi:hypothetical protein